jgi:hypothetical protein
MDCSFLVCLFLLSGRLLLVVKIEYKINKDANYRSLPTFRSGRKGVPPSAAGGVTGYYNHSLSETALAYYARILIFHAI